MTSENNKATKFLTEETLAQRLPVWCTELDITTQAPLQLKRPALLVLDMQNEFLTDQGQMPVWGGPAVISRVKNTLGAFRQAGFPVFFTRHLCIEPYRHQGELGVMENVSEPSEFLADGCYSAELHESIQPRRGEQVIDKYRYSAFYDTPLDTLLRVNGVTDVVIAGVATNICCETTAHDAYFRGFNVFFAVDGCGGTDEKAHLASLKNIALVYGVPVAVASIISSIGSM